MPNRLNRDQILNRALDLLDSAALDAKDRPSGTIVSTALSIGWLQEAIDYFHKKFPFSATISTHVIAIAQGSNTISQPDDFIIDYRDGVVLGDDKGRLHRKGLNAILSRSVKHVGPPAIYTVRGNVIQFWPKADQSYSGLLYYYALPAALEADTIPQFPDDSVLTDYVWIKGQEWHKEQPPGSARKYADEVVRSLQASGLGPEAESDEIPLEATYVMRSGPADWMGT